MPRLLDFDKFFIPVDTWIEAIVDWLVGNFRAQFQIIKWPVEVTLEGINAFLNWLSPSVVLLALTLIAWKLSGKKVALFSLVTFFLVGCMGLWSETMTTLAMVLSA